MTAKTPGSLDPMTTELVGIAAAVAGHCEPCFVYHYNEALNLGIPFVAIEEAVNLAGAVHRAGQKHMEEFATRRMGKPAKAVAKASA
jgi:AhpD family alkylhydroperoxidase